MCIWNYCNGVLQLLKYIFPCVHLHISLQATLTGATHETTQDQTVPWTLTLRWSFSSLHHMIWVKGLSALGTTKDKNPQFGSSVKNISYRSVVWLIFL